MSSEICDRVDELAPAVDYWSCRLVEHSWRQVFMRGGVLQPPGRGGECGLMIEVRDGGGCAYAAIDRLDDSSIRAAFSRARRLAESSAAVQLLDASLLPRPEAQAHWQAPIGEDPFALPLSDWIDRVAGWDRAFGSDDRIINRVAYLVASTQNSVFTNSIGARIEQRQNMIMPYLEVVARSGSELQSRSNGSHVARSGGMEQLAIFDADGCAATLAAEAIALLSAENCPTERCDLILEPSQMVLQIHESIGHPLELDRILGDERNYAGTSFVRPDMFGSYRYGSELLNICFDPTVEHELASYAFDDEGTPAERQYLIERGILKRGLGGRVSQERSALPGVACARASAWNRPPIDRMANINLEPGDTPLAEMIAGCEHGIVMAVNRSWSIDDSRNKFQFGCEYGRLIRNGELGGLVKNPNYRGISADFWRGLTAVGPREEWLAMGTPNCGKGEPNQMIKVGHGAPPCCFADVEIFGGA